MGLYMQTYCAYIKNKESVNAEVAGKSALYCLCCVISIIAQC